MRTFGSNVALSYCTAGLVTIFLGCSDTVAPVALGSCNPPSTGSWTYLGLEGNWVMALAETPWGLYAGTSDNGVYRCSPETGKWEALGVDHAQVSAILFVPGPTPRLLVGVRPYADEQTAAAVFATEDRGRTWLPWDDGLAAQYDNRQWAFSLAMDPSNPERLYMGQSFPLLRSTDAGLSWEYVFGSADEFGGGIYTVVVSPERSGRVYAGGQTGFFAAAMLRSEDWGDTWETVFPTPGFDNGVFGLAVDTREPARIWAALGGNRSAIMRSEDAGRTWQFVLELREGGFTDILADGDRMYALGFDNVRPPPDNIGYQFTDLALYRSGDRGSTWARADVPEGVAGSATGVIDSQGRLLIGTRLRGGGVWRFQP